jgi:hypothetical protein
MRFATRCFAGIFFAAVLSLLILQIVLHLSLLLRGKPKYSMRDLLPPLHLAANSTLRRQILWRKDLRCGAPYLVHAVGAYGRDVMVPAGCNPHGKKPCCSNSHSCGRSSYTYCRAPGALDYRTDDRAFDLQLLILSQKLGPRARLFGLTGSEWRQDFLCGPDVMVMEWASASEMDMREAACNPDSPDRYLCDVDLSTCTGSNAMGHSNGFRKNDSALRKSGWRADTMTTKSAPRRDKVRRERRTKRTIDYRRRESWDARRGKMLALDFNIKHHLVHFENGAHTFVNPNGTVQSNMLLEGFAGAEERDSSTNSNSNSSGRNPTPTATSIAPPHWYYINMDTHPDKSALLEQSLARGGVRASDITRISAVTPAHMRDNSWHVPGKAKNDQERAVTLSHLRAIKRAWEDNKARAAKGLPQLTALIVEDDLSLELAVMWKIPPSRIAPRSASAGAHSIGDPVAHMGETIARPPPRKLSITLYDVFRELALANKNWEICQLSMTCFWMGECKTFVAEMAEKLAEGHIVLPRKSFGRHGSLWGAVAYAVTPKGQARILDMVWPGGKNGAAFSDLSAGQTFSINERRYVVADALLFQSTRRDATFFSARPLFCSKAVHSHLHDDHLRNHARSKYLMESVLYLGHDVRNTSSWQDVWREYGSK